jgi:hypothetical protein
MRRLAEMLLVLALAGCSSNQSPRPSAVPADQEAPLGDIQKAPLQDVQEAPLQDGEILPSQRYSSPAATAAAPPNADISTGKLMDCVTQSCKINCSPKVAERFRPKWCANFKEPAE